MKKLAFVIPTQLSEDGLLSIKSFRSLELMINNLKPNYEITLIVRNQREKIIPVLDDWGVFVIYDNSVQKDIEPDCPSRFQSSYLRWANRGGIESACEKASVQEYDCLVAWDGCSPWCLATTLTEVRAERRIFWLHDDLNLYLMSADHDFYSGLCEKFDVVITSDEEKKKAWKNIVHNKDCIVIELPIDTSWYWEQSEEQMSCQFYEEKINLLAISRMSVECEAEKLPRRIAEFCEQRSMPPVHYYLIGDGVRMDRYIQKIALYDVDRNFTLLGKMENPYPYIRTCDALIICGDERNRDAENAAKCFGVPVIRSEKLGLVLPELKKKENTTQRESVSWLDKEKFTRLLNAR